MEKSQSRSYCLKAQFGQEVRQRTGRSYLTQANFFSFHKPYMAYILNIRCMYIHVYIRNTCYYFRLIGFPSAPMSQLLHVYVCMYVCMHVCMYLCTYIYIYIYTYVCNVCICIYICIHTYCYYFRFIGFYVRVLAICMYVCIYVCIYIAIIFILQVSISELLHVCVHVCVYVHYVCIYCQ